MNDLHFMPHQEEALNRTEQFNRCAYYLDMGLGKTFVGAEKMYLLNNSVNLVICQKSKIDDWVQHFKDYYPSDRVMNLTKKSEAINFRTLVDTNAAYDPRNNNCMCINGQLMLLDLIEHLEVVPGFELIQSNTDGLIIWIPDTDEAFEMVDDICWEWEQRCSTDQCSILLELDNISEIYQKDVNNYLWVGIDGGVERIGAYVKELSAVDNDLPILNKALVDYMVKKTPVEQTINQCDDLIMFQKIVKLSDKYDWVEHEHCTPLVSHIGKRTIKTVYEYPDKDKYTYKSYRVFASNDQQHGRLLKRKQVKTKGEKFGNTPDHCFIFNDSVVGVKTPPELDRQWYIDLAKKRLKQFGVVA